MNTKYFTLLMIVTTSINLYCSDFLQKKNASPFSRSFLTQFSKKRDTYLRCMHERQNSEEFDILAILLISFFGLNNTQTCQDHAYYCGAFTLVAIIQRMCAHQIARNQIHNRIMEESIEAFSLKDLENLQKVYKENSDDVYFEMFLNYGDDSEIFLDKDSKRFLDRIVVQKKYLEQRKNPK